jgi:hypothetical protein
VILGAEGYMELRKDVDLAARPGRDHLFMVDVASREFIDCSMHMGVRDQDSATMLGFAK